ncbi:MAG TPA: HAD family phosphatase [Sphingopyxis sp.]|nr:HAD family phosphatase [Sphingopyxis sp.]
MSYCAVIFDFDGVVADSEVRANQCLAESLTAIGLPTSYEESLRDYCGNNWQETERRIVARFGAPLPADFREQHRARARVKFADGFQAVDGVSEFLGQMGALPRAIASSSNPDYIHMSLERFGLKNRFAPHIYSADGWARGKPYPDIYLAAAKGLGADPAQCLALEDSPIGARAAVAAGMTVIGFCGGGHILDAAAHGDKLRAVGVHHVARNYGEVADIAAL